MRRLIIKFAPVLLLITLSIFFASSNSVLAQSGCCSYHGGVSHCDSSVGRQVCNDGTYSPSCVCYSPPAKPVCEIPTVGDSGTWDFTQSGCNQNITFKWDKGNDDVYYSVAISKYAGADPGPLSDTRLREFTFKEITTGTWYINVKPGNSCGWGDVRYWTVEVPNATPIISTTKEKVTDNKYLIKYDIKCAAKASITPEVGVIPTGKNFVTVEPKSDQTYTVTALNKNEEEKGYIYISMPKTDDETTKIELTSVKEVGSTKPINTSTADSLFTKILKRLGVL